MKKKSEIQEPAVATYVTITNIYTLNTLNSHLDVNIGNDGLIYFGRVQISSNKQSSEKVKVKRGNGIAANSWKKYLSRFKHQNQSHNTKYELRGTWWLLISTISKSVPNTEVATNRVVVWPGF